MIDENVARKPADVDPERLDNIASNIDLQLEHEKPDYTELNMSLSRKNITGANFDPNMTVPEYVRGTVRQLRTIQRYLHGRDIQRIKRSQVLQITKELFEYQLKDMQHLLLLGMDVQKKTRFIQYLETTKALQNRIQKESAAAQLAVIDTMFDTRIEAYKNKNKRDLELYAMYKKGVLNEEQYATNKADNQARIDEHVQRLDQTTDLLITRHAEFLFKTLELFRAALIKEEVL